MNCLVTNDLYISNKDRVGKFEGCGGSLFGWNWWFEQVSVKVLRRQNWESKSRCICTNKNIKKLIESNDFREDLYHRLAVIEIKIPTLSERKSDIKILCNYFIKQISNEQGLSEKKISKEAISALENYPWSGNIRELRNVIERLMILGENPISVENINMYAPK